MTDFWIETSYRDGSSSSVPFLGTLISAQERCAQLVARDYLQLIEFVLLLSGDYSPGTIARVDQILGDWQGYAVPGSKKWRSRKCHHGFLRPNYPKS